MHFVAGAVEEAGVDEDGALGGGADAGGEVGGGAAFFVHDAHFEGMARQAAEVFDGGEEFVGKAHFFGAVHFGFDDVHGAAAAVFVFATLEVEGGGEGGDDAVEDAFGDFVACGIEHGGGGHQVADVADEKQRAAGQGESAAAVGLGVLAVGVEAADKGFAAFFDAFFQRAAHQAEPVGVDEGFVFTVDSGDGVFAVHDGGEGGFEDDVFDACGVLAADGAVFVDEDVDVQAVVQEEERGGRGFAAVVAGEEFGRFEAGFAAVDQAYFQTACADVIQGGVFVAAVFEGQALVEEIAGEGDNGFAALRVVGFAGGEAAALVYCVCAVEGVVEAAPAGVGGVEGVAGVVDGDDELGAGLFGQFAVDVLRGDFEGGGFVGKIADVFEEGAVGRSIAEAVFFVPLVDFGLDFVAFCQEFAVARGEASDEFGKALPEGVGFDVGMVRQKVFADETVEMGVDLQTGCGDVAVRHVGSPKSVFSYLHCVAAARRNLNSFLQTRKGRLKTRRRFQTASAVWLQPRQ
ncbi:hypothetical protein HMPREF9120_02535 [Neisseria sp. oral taxon 020 str. F0370]|nr:hypothetical protein HMPREF9120_02535 [Neisseria sp. oral taxon 020 str. F0370]